MVPIILQVRDLHGDYERLDIYQKETNAMRKLKAFLFIFCLVLFYPNLSLSKGLKGDITLGAGSIDLNVESSRYGEYDGIDEDGIHLIAEADLFYLKDDYFLDFKAEDLGLDNRYILLDSGRVGRYHLYLKYDESPHLISTGETPFLGAGRAVLLLPTDPTDFVEASDTSGMTDLSFYKRDLDMDVDRTTSSIGYSRHLRKNLDFALSFKRTEQDGIQSIGGVVGSVGGYSSSVILPEPVDYKTDELKAAIEYSGEKAAMNLSFFISTFKNSNESLTWDNPFDERFGTAFPDEARLALSPDNQHQGIRFTGIIKKLPYNSRLTLNAGYSKMEQDEEFLPYTINSSSIVTSDLPRDSADANINIARLTLNLVSRPIKKLSINTRYRYYSTYNETDSDEFLKVLNDTGDQVSSSSSDALYNLPPDYAQNRLNIDASYRLSSRTRLKLGYAHEIMNRDFSYVEETKENSYSASVNSTLSSYAIAGASYSLSSRRMTDDYDGSIVYESYHAVGIYDQDSMFDNHPLIQNYDLADKDSAQYGLNLTLLPSDKTTISVVYNNMHDDYIDSVLGLQESDQQNFTVDLTAVLSRDVSLFTYYTNELLELKQANIDFQTYAEAQDLSQGWYATHEDRNDTIGLGSKISFNRDLMVDMDYSLSKSKGEITFDGAVDMPSLETSLETFSLTGKYRIDKKMTIALGYQYEDYKASDWASDDISPASIDIDYILTLYNPEQDYTAHLYKIFLTYSL